MTHDSSVSDGPRSASDTPTETYRVEAHNRRDALDGTDHRRFDFRLTRTDETSTVDSMVVDLLAAYLGVAGEHLDTTVQPTPRVANVSVEGTRSPSTSGAGSGLASLEASVHVETSLASDALETWRVALRDDAATQQAVPPGVQFSLRVTRVSRHPPSP